MQVHVKLYGTLGKHVAGYDHRRGPAVDVPGDATVTDLLSQLAVPLKRVGVVSVNGRLVGRSAPFEAGALVKVFHPIFGG